jgi:GNAT superfamily N-acetyltransferase
VRVRPTAPSGSPHQGPALLPFGLPEPSAAAGLSSGPPSPPAVGAPPIHYQRVFHLSPSNLAPYAALTFPSLAPGSPALGRVQGELLGLSAMAAGAMVGFAIAERRGDGRAQLLSLMVAPAWRRRGIGSGLLARLMLFVLEEGAAPLAVRYKATPELVAGFEPLLARLGWSTPRTDFVLLEGHSQPLAAIGWADRHPISPPYRLLPWGELDAAQCAAAAELDAPAELRPHPEISPPPDPGLSLALLHHDTPVGWLLVHRTGPQALRYSSLFVAPAHRGRARALALLHEGFRRQHAAAIPTARAAIDRRNDAMLRLLRRHLGAHLSAIGRSRSSQAPPDPPPERPT